MLGMVRDRSVLLVAVLFVLVGVVAPSGAIGQTWSGVVTTPGGWTYTWRITFSSTRQSGYWINPNPDQFEIVEGPEIELEPLEGEVSEEDEAYEVRSIDVARLLMRSEAELVDDEFAVHRCVEGRCPVPCPDRGKRLVRTRELELEAAEGLYRSHLESYQGDAVAMRELAVAYVEQKKYGEAAALMVEAYTADPDLGIEPLSEGIVGDFALKMRDLVAKTVRWVNREPSAEGWLVVSVLMQSEGRHDLARSMLERAAELGLDRAIVDSVGRGLAM